MSAQMLWFVQSVYTHTHTHINSLPTAGVTFRTWHDQDFMQSKIWGAAAAVDAQ